MPKKSRDPNNFNCSDYISWLLEIVDIRERLIATGEWPMHIDADFVTLRNELMDAQADYEDKRQYLVKTATPAHEEAAEKVYKRIVMFKRLLPTLFDGDEAVLTEFSINEEIPIDRDELVIMAKNCLDHWNEITDPDVPPEYTPVEAFFTEYATECADFEAAHDAHIDATREKEIAETLVDTKREACHKAERLIFTWFRGIHIDPGEKWWEDTPWGTASGGGEEPGGELPEIPDKPEGVYANFMTEPVIAMLVGCGKYGEHTGFDVVRAVTPAGVTETPTRPEELLATNIDVINEPLLDTDIDPGYRYWYWVRARNGDEVGEWSEVVWVEYL